MTFHIIFHIISNSTYFTYTLIFKICSKTTSTNFILIKLNTFTILKIISTFTYNTFHITNLNLFITISIIWTFTNTFILINRKSIIFFTFLTSIIRDSYFTIINSSWLTNTFTINIRIIILLTYYTFIFSSLFKLYTILFIQ